MNIAQLKMLGIRRYEGATLPTRPEDHVHVEELPASWKPWHHAAYFDQIALDPRRCREDGIASTCIALDLVARPLRVAAVKIGAPQLDPSQVAEAPTQSQLVGGRGYLFDCERRKIVQRHSPSI